MLNPGWGSLKRSSRSLEVRPLSTFALRKGSCLADGVWLTHAAFRCVASPCFRRAAQSIGHAIKVAGGSSTTIVKEAGSAPWLKPAFAQLACVSGREAWERVSSNAMNRDCGEAPVPAVILKSQRLFFRFPSIRGQQSL